MPALYLLAGLKEVSATIASWTAVTARLTRTSKGQVRSYGAHRDVIGGNPHAAICMLAPQQVAQMLQSVLYVHVQHMNSACWL